MQSHSSFLFVQHPGELAAILLQHGLPAAAAPAAAGAGSSRADAAAASAAAAAPAAAHPAGFQSPRARSKRPVAEQQQQQQQPADRVDVDLTEDSPPAKRARFSPTRIGAALRAAALKAELQAEEDSELEAAIKLSLGIAPATPAPPSSHVVLDVTGDSPAAMRTRSSPTRSASAAAPRPSSGQASGGSGQHLAAAMAAARVANAWSAHGGGSSGMSAKARGKRAKSASTWRDQNTSPSRIPPGAFGFDDAREAYWQHGQDAQRDVAARRLAQQQQQQPPPPPPPKPKPPPYQPPPKQPPADYVPPPNGMGDEKGGEAAVARYRDLASADLEEQRAKRADAERKMSAETLSRSEERSCRERV